MKKSLPFSFNVFFFSGIAFFSPFMVLFYQSLGFSGTQIGLLVGLAPLITLFGAPLWTGIADATRRHRLLMGISLLGGAVCLVAFPILRTFPPILALALALTAFLAPTGAFADSATLFMLGEDKNLYGRIRMGGTIGFGLASPLAGMLVQNQGLKLAFWGAAGLFFLAFLTSRKFVHGSTYTGSSPMAGLRALLADRKWVHFLTVAFAGGLAGAASINYFYPYMKELGANETTMGLALAIGTISEVPVFFFSNRLIRRMGASGLLMFAMIVTVLRMLLLAAVSSPGPVLLIQLSAGLTFPAMWVAGVSFAEQHAPQGMSATAQGLFGAMVMGFGMAVGGFSGGLLLESVGGRGLYLGIGSAVLLILLASLFILRSAPAQEKAV